MGVSYHTSRLNALLPVFYCDLWIARTYFYQGVIVLVEAPAKKRDFYHIVFIPNQWYKPPHIIIWQKPPITWMKSLTEQDSEGFPTGENAGVLANFNDRQSWRSALGDYSVCAYMGHIWVLLSLKEET